MPYGMAPLRDEEIGVARVVGGAGRAGRRRPTALPARAQQRGRQAGRRFLNGDSLKQRITAPLSLRALVPGPPVLRELPGGPVLRDRPLAHRAGRADRRDRHGAPLRRSGRRARSGTACGRSTRRSCTRRTSSIRSATRSCSACASCSSTATGSRREFPAYTPEVASNPFVAFAADARAQPLPVPARRRAVLRHDVHPRPGVPRPGRRRRDRGPVLGRVHGSRPRSRRSSIPSSWRRTPSCSSLPAEHQSDFGPGELWLEYDRKQRKYLDARAHYYDVIDPQHRGPTLDWIWDGDGTNPQRAAHRLPQLRQRGRS